MNTIKISHEMPYSMLAEGWDQKLNDYSYALVHLFEPTETGHDPQAYYDYMVRQLREGRDCILDNSIFELDVAFDAERFAYWIEWLAKDCGPKALDEHLTYIIPDVCDDAAATIRSAKAFVDAFPDLPGKRMMVAQGNSTSELIDCYIRLNQITRLDRTGISFNCKAYDNDFPEIESKLHRWSFGRRFFVKAVVARIASGDILEHSPMHLLGCSLPQEFKEYASYAEHIVSVDTSNPIIHGMYGIEYQGKAGLEDKMSVKLAELFNSPMPDASHLATIQRNCAAFREILNG